MTKPLWTLRGLLALLAALPLVNVPSLEVWGYVLISVMLNTVYRLFLIKAYETGDFGQVYPVMRGVPPVLVAVFSYFLCMNSCRSRRWRECC